MVQHLLARPLDNDETRPSDKPTANAPSKAAVINEPETAIGSTAADSEKRNTESSSTGNETPFASEMDGGAPTVESQRSDATPTTGDESSVALSATKVELIVATLAPSDSQPIRKDKKVQFLTYDENNNPIYVTPGQSEESGVD